MRHLRGVLLLPHLSRLGRSLLGSVHFFTVAPGTHFASARSAGTEGWAAEPTVAWVLGRSVLASPRLG